MSGLTSRQQWTHDHLRRCDGCGAWEIVTDIELRMRAADQWPDMPGPCAHIEEAFGDNSEERRAHAAYVRGERDEVTVEGERAYARRMKRRRRIAAQATFLDFEEAS